MPVWQDSAPDPDAAVLFGGADSVNRVTLMKVFITAQISIEFSDQQTGFQLWRARPLQLQTDDTPIRRAFQLFTIEISIRDRERLGHTAVNWV